MSLFVYDFSTAPGTALITVMGDAQILLPPASEIQNVYYKNVDNYTEQSKFLVIYIPRSSSTMETMLQLVADYSQLLNSDPAISFEVFGIYTKERSLIFTGKIFIYYDSFLDLGQLGEVYSAFSAKGLQVELRGQDYAGQIWTDIQAGQTEAPGRVAMCHGLPTAVNSSTSFKCPTPRTLPSSSTENDPLNDNN